eukprot:COSAG02_NODE_7928_length_2782_cov_2.250466_2_plen_92_part_00
MTLPTASSAECVEIQTTAFGLSAAISFRPCSPEELSAFLSLPCLVGPGETEDIVTDGWCHVHQNGGICSMKHHQSRQNVHRQQVRINGLIT